MGSRQGDRDQTLVFQKSREAEPQCGNLAC